MPSTTTLVEIAPAVKTPPKMIGPRGILSAKVGFHDRRVSMERKAGESPVLAKAAMEWHADGVPPSQSLSATIVRETRITILNV